ncbi:MAG: FtsX-like permease family protein [Caldilineaceae bacterium]
MKALSIMARLGARWRRFWRIAPAHLATTARSEWQLGVLALVGLAPGVAALAAWNNLAIQAQRTGAVVNNEWLLPAFLLDAIGLEGVLVGAGMVTLLIGCLALTNLYLASLERRLETLVLWRGLGLTLLEVRLLLGLEALAAGALGSGVGLLLGMLLSRLSWPAAQRYFGLAQAHDVTALPLFSSLATGMLAALCFMGAALVTVQMPTAILLRGEQVHPLNTWREMRASAYGALFAGLLTLFAALLILPLTPALWLSGTALLLAMLLTSGGWLLTRLYARLPTPASAPLWTLAVQNLARFPNRTAGMVLALTTGAFGVGMAALSWLDGQADEALPLWVAGMVLAAGASLVLAIAALAARERRAEFRLLRALGARSSRVRRLILMEYAVVALGGGSLGALIALANWAMTGGEGGWLRAIALVIVDLLGALLSAWAGAVPVMMYDLRYFDRAQHKFTIYERSRQRSSFVNRKSQIVHRKDVL